jgi:hypothetical protein
MPEVLGVSEFMYSSFLGGSADIKTSVFEEDNLDGGGSVIVMLKALLQGEFEAD